MNLAPTVELADGTLIPQLGLGVLRVASNDVVAPIKQALGIGYRHIDTAAVYGNEEGVGVALRDSNVDRADVFLTTKVWNTDLGHARTRRAFDRSMDRLGVDYVDLYLIHWPTDDFDQLLGSWQALVEIQAEGRARAIGVSNFLGRHLEKLSESSSVKPVVNQIELHPWFQQHELRMIHRDQQIRTEAWSPLGQGQVLADPVLADIAAKHKRSVAQVILRWHLDLGHVVIPKSTNPSRLAENIDVFDYTLDDEDNLRIAELDRDYRIGSHPDRPPTSRLPYDD